MGAEQLKMAAKRRLLSVSKHLTSTEVESTVPIDSYLPADQECAQPELLRPQRALIGCACCRRVRNGEKLVPHYATKQWEAGSMPDQPGDGTGNAAFAGSTETYVDLGDGED